MPSPAHSHTPLVLYIQDRGAELRTEEGKLVVSLPDLPAGSARRQAWGEALVEAAPRGTQIQLLLSHAGVTVHCQDAPFLGVKERREVAERLALGESGRGPQLAAATLDPDPGAEGGHALWVATAPRSEMADWRGAVEDAGFQLVHALPMARALLRGLESLPNQPQDRVVLMLEGDEDAHLCIFRGRSLQFMRSFRIPLDPDEAGEVLFEEVSRLVQFSKQKLRSLVFDRLFLVGGGGFSPALSARFRTSLRLDLAPVAPVAWALWAEGLRRERHRRDGLNLLPLDLLEAQQRRLTRAAVWTAAVLVVLLFVGASAAMWAFESNARRQAEEAERLLAEREAHSEDERRIIAQRTPILRLRAVEQRQGEAAKALGRLGARIFAAPKGVFLEQVDVFELGGEAKGHGFKLSGTVLSEGRFSVGPLADYLRALAAEPGVQLSPLQEVSVSDRVEGEGGKVDRRAVTRFVIEGSAP